MRYIVVYGLLLFGVYQCHGAYIIGWGADSTGQVSAIPTGNDYVAVAGGAWYGIALRENGSLVAWGGNPDIINVPVGNNYKAISAGAFHAVALRQDGSLVAWGSNYDGQCDDVPLGNNYVAIATGDAFNLALKTDGSIVGWGHDEYNNGVLTDIPAGNGFVAITATYPGTAAAMKQDGTIVAWGYGLSPNFNGSLKIASAQTDIVGLQPEGKLISNAYGSPAPPGNDYVDVVGCKNHFLALRTDGSVVAWSHENYNGSGQLDVPNRNDFVGIGGGFDFSLGLVSTPEPLSLSLLALGGVALVRRRQENRISTTEFTEGHRERQ